MEIQFVCEHCGKPLKVQEYQAGQGTECYFCHQPVVIPQEGERAVIEFQCLGCGSQFRVPSSRAGSRTKCPKCGAVLVVPAAKPPTPPPRAVDPYAPIEAGAAQTDMPPPPPAPLLRRHTAAARHPGRPGYAQAPAGFPQGQGDEDYIPPPARGVSAGMIIFWVSVSLLFLVALVILAMHVGDGGPGRGPDYDPIYAEVKYNGLIRIFQVINTTQETWANVKFTIETSQGDFTTSVGGLPPKEPLTLEEKQFVGPGGTTFDTGSVTPRRFIIRAQLPSGRTGEFVMKWGGPRKTEGGGPAPAPKKAPAKEPENPPDEGGAIID